MTQRPDDLLAQIGPDNSFDGSSCCKHDCSRAAAAIDEENTRNLTFRLAGKANIPIREHVLTFSSGTQSIRATVPDDRAERQFGKGRRARVRVGLCEQIPTRVGEVAGQDLSASVRHAEAANSEQSGTRPSRSGLSALRVRGVNGDHPESHAVAHSGSFGQRQQGEISSSISP